MYRGRNNGQGSNRDGVLFYNNWYFSGVDSLVFEHKENQEKMIDIDLLKNGLKRDEGFISHAYQDSRGYLTIGYGRLIDKNLGGGITKDEADLLLTNDIAGTIFELQDNFEWFKGLSPNRKIAIINMVFNLGMPRFKGFKKMIKAIEQGHYLRASTEALDSKWAKQVGERATHIAKIINEG